MQNIAQVIVPNLDPLDYLIPADTELMPGDLISVIFRNKKTIALVYKITNSTEVPFEKLKPINSKLNIRISELDLKFLSWIAEYYLFSLGHVFKLIIPAYTTKWLLEDKLKLDLEKDSFQKIVFNNINFNKQQLEAIAKITAMIDQERNNIIIDGVTGSGKTEIYLSAAEHILRKDSTAQILVLLPEISLTNQITNRIARRFNIEPTVWHSSISNKNKRQNFAGIINGSKQIIIGARSALFLPFKNLKLIIVDEEHDYSYKQEEGVTYQARDMAMMRSKLGNIPIILSSASPSLETIHNISLNKVNLVTLDQRYNENLMPEVKIIDMKKEAKKNSFLSLELIRALKNNLLKEQQSLLFLNRKGYSPSLICSGCGYKVICKYCSTSLVYHKLKKKLQCHQCGYVEAIPKKCPCCDSENKFSACGPGVERIAEEISSLFPEAKIITLTQESFDNIAKAENLINSIINNEYNIIIGTQIIAKGHHFPALTLVGIIDADIFGGGGDLRSAEKTFQLLQQVGGRAGREIENSTIYIQTYNPEDPLLTAIAKYDRAKFIEAEMQTRKDMYMPPFGRLAAFILSSSQEKKLIDFVSLLIKSAPQSKEFNILGPAPAIIYKLRGKFRYRILIKTAKNINIQKFITTWLEPIKIPSHIHLKIDIDPYYFL